MSTEFAMQTRCVHCLREQYVMAVPGVSAGEEPCVWCGKLSTPMSYDEWWKALDDRQKERAVNQDTA